MTEHIKPSWLRLSNHKLHALIHKEYPEEMAKRIVEQVTQIKKAQRSNKQKVLKHAQLWAEMLAPLREELSTVRTLKWQASSLLRTQDDKELQDKHAVYCDYEATLLKLRDWFNVVRVGGFTPVQLVAEMKRKGKWHPDVRGDHWVDFIPERNKHALQQRYNAAMDNRPARSGRRKELFSRTLTREQWTEKRDLLFKQIDAERQLLAVGNTDSAQWQSTRMRVEAANFKLTEMRPPAYLPAHWTSLVEADPSLLAERSIAVPARIRKESAKQAAKQAAIHEQPNLPDEEYIARITG